MTRKLHIIEFINGANIIYNNIYDYTLVNRINSHTKTTVVCKEHMDFFPTPKNYLSKKPKCPLCARYTVIEMWKSEFNKGCK